MTDNVLMVSELRAGYGDEDVLRGVSLEVPRGSIVAMIGPNGSGKSTLLKAIYGLVPVRAGRVALMVEGAAICELAGMRPHRITALGVNMVPQLANVFADLSVFENLEIGAVLNRSRMRVRIDAVLAALPALAALLPRRAATLSGGQRQMLAVGRALMSDPRLLILDEPSAGLAPRVQDEVFGMVRRVNTAGVSVLMVEQRARQCLAISDYGYVLEQGRNRLEGPAQALLRDPEVVRLYLGVRAAS